MITNENDDVDFVFLDDDSRPYRVMDWFDHGTWLFYWHPDNKWVSLRKLKFSEVMLLSLRALPEEQAKLYQDIAQ